MFPSHDISEVVNNNPATEGDTAVIAGKGVGAGNGSFTYKLMSYLGYGNFVPTTPPDAGRWWSTSLKKTNSPTGYTQQYIQNNYVNLFPLLAYQKIYQDFFRWSQWERANPSSYNVDYYTGSTPNLMGSNGLPSHDSDYWKSDTMFDLKYCNWNKDMLMGVLPNSQFGDVAVLDISNSGASDVVLGPDGKKSKVGVASAVTSKTSGVWAFLSVCSFGLTLSLPGMVRLLLWVVAILFALC